MNPLDLLYSWHGILIACAVIGITQFVKTVFDIVWGKVDDTPTPTMIDAKKVGEVRRKRNIIINRIILPATPIVAGAILSILIPVHPEILITYINEHVSQGWQHYTIYAGWGAAVGQFSDYTFSKVKAVFGDVKKARESTVPPE